MNFPDRHSESAEKRACSIDIGRIEPFDEAVIDPLKEHLRICGTALNP